MMSPLKTFAVRMVVSVIFSYIACRIFLQGADLLRVGGLALLMLGLAYLFEWARKRRES